MINGTCSNKLNDIFEVETTEQAYDSEDLLQELLEKYPNLLAGDQILEKRARAAVT